jgi:hypothetical protein
MEKLVSVIYGRPVDPAKIAEKKHERGVKDKDDADVVGVAAGVYPLMRLSYFLDTLFVFGFL